MKRVLSVLLLFTAFSMNAKSLAEFSSPDAKISFKLSFDGSLKYEVFKSGERILAPSTLSLSVDGNVWGNDAKPLSIKKKSFLGEETFVVPRKYAKMQHSYSELVLKYREYDIEFRAYNDGVAYRFVGKKKGEYYIENEALRFAFDKDYESYTLLTGNLQNWFEEDYSEKNLSELSGDVFSIIPVMVQAGNHRVLLAEANLYDYPGLYLRPDGFGFRGVHAAYPAKEEFFDGTNKIYATEREDYLVKCYGSRTFPWRVAGIFDKDVDIIKSELVYLLSDKAEKDYSWIRPGKVLWDWWNHNNITGVDFKAGINTATYMYMLDFASQHGIEYILIDEGWSGRDDLLALNPEVDMPSICKYAKEKGVGVILWAKWINVDKQLDEAFEMMKSWEVKGVKIDFMDRNDAKMVSFYERVARKAEECRLLVDFHGSYPNEGMRAKYPLLMTREGVIGLEYNKWSNRATPHHDLIIPYLRMWVGPMDYTPGAMLNAQKETFFANQFEPMSQGTRCHQLAMYVVYESPLQMLSDSPSKYAQNADCFEFLKHVPTVWDDTLPLFGEIGSNVAVARRSEDKWYVGVMVDKAQSLKLSFDFLPEGEYLMTYYADGHNAELNGKDYYKEEISVRNSDVLDLKLSTGGGFAAVIIKK